MWLYFLNLTFIVKISICIPTDIFLTLTKGDKQLNVLYESIVNGKLESVVAVTQEAIADGINPQKIINDYMIKALDEIVQQLFGMKLETIADKMKLK